MTYVRQAPASQEFKDWFQRAIKLISRQAGRIIPEEEHMPMLFVYEKDGTIVPMAIPFFGDNDSKDLTALLQRTLASSPTIFAVMLVTEAWTVAWDSMDEAKKYQHGDLSKDPRRKEILMLNAIADGGRMQMLANIAIETVNGKRRLTDDMMVVDTGDPMNQTTGRFIGTGDDNKLDS